MGIDQAIPAALALDGLSTLDARASFDVASDAKYRGISFATNHRELNPETLGQSARRHVKTILAARQLDIESLRAAAPRGGLADSTTIDRTLENARKAIHLARELGVGTVSLNVGAIGGADSVPEATVVSALRDLSQQADAAGVSLALSAEQMEKLPMILKQVDYDRARLNLEGGRLIGAGENPLTLLEQYGQNLGQFTAADAVRAGKSVRAAMLGEGQLPLEEIMQLLREHGYSGPLVVDVRDLPDGIAGARHAADILRKLFHRA